MFRMIRLKPPHGWGAVAWELGIVTLGVLIALGAQQWMEDREWHDKVLQSQQAIRDELAMQYHWSVEWRMVMPCMGAQLDQLEQRVERSGERLEPAPVYSDGALSSFVFRMPSKEYSDAAWQAAIADGVPRHLDPALRLMLNDLYVQAVSMRFQTGVNDEDFMALQVLGRPLRLDPMVRFSLLQRLRQLRGRIEFMDLQTGQLINRIEEVGMMPDVAKTQAAAERYGTYHFCKAHDLPLRSFQEARVGLPD